MSEPRGSVPMRGVYRLFPKPQKRDKRYATKKLKLLILERDNNSCRYCGRWVSYYQANCDHVIPWVRGGRTDMANLVTSCRECNKKKGNWVRIVDSDGQDAPIYRVGEGFGTEIV